MSDTQGSLSQRISEAMKSALRSGDKRRLGTIRLVMSAIKQREVDERIALDDTQTLAVLEKMIKQRRDSINQYQSAQRQDLVDQEEYEIGVLQEYMPAALSEAEIDAMIAAAITSTGAASAKDIGKVIGAVKAEMQGRADMGKVSAKIKAKLGG